MADKTGLMLTNAGPSRRNGEPGFEFNFKDDSGVHVAAMVQALANLLIEMGPEATPKPNFCEVRLSSPAAELPYGKTGILVTVCWIDERGERRPSVVCAEQRVRIAELEAKIAAMEAAK